MAMYVSPRTLFGERSLSSSAKHTPGLSIDVHYHNHPSHVPARVVVVL